MKREELKVKSAYGPEGITLIALIITVIVLLILAGVSINLLIGDNGIIKQAQMATREHKKAQYFEEINLEILEEKTERAIRLKEEPLIVSLKKRIQEKSWTSEDKVLMCKETENGFEAQEKEEDNNILLIETNDKYEIIVEVDNILQDAQIREEYFEKVGKRFKVVLDPNGANGNKEEKEVRKNFKIKLEEPNYSKSGYKFVGWCENSDGSGTRYLAESELKVEKNIRLYAIWELNVVTITLVSNYGEGEQIQISVEKNTTPNLPTNTFERSKYAFIKWNTKEDGSGTDYEDGDSITASKDIILYAQWELSVATIVFNINYGTNPTTSELNVKPGVAIPIPNVSSFQREGYVLTKWNTKEDGTGIDYTTGANITINADIVLYAQWEIKPTATMSFKVNGTTGVNKLTEGTTIAIGGTATGGGIKSVQLKIGNQVVYTEQLNGATTYNKEIAIGSLNNLANLTFCSRYTATLTVTSVNNNWEQKSVENVQNFTVGSAASLKQLATIVNGGNTLEGETVLQISDIDLSSVCSSSKGSWEPIGYSSSTSYWFNGTYNGNGKNVTSLYIYNNGVDKTVGLFGFLRI